MTDYNWSGTEILDTWMPENDPEAHTIRDYLKALLTRLWEEGEGFNGKRPFGNSGWEYDIYAALVENRHFEEDDYQGMNEAIYSAIKAL